MSKDEALKLALKAMLNFPEDISDEMFEAITAIKEALAQEQERPAPCAKHCEATALQITIKNLEAQLAKRTWVGLTDEEFHDLQIENIDDPWANFKAIEAKLKEKNT